MKTVTASTEIFSKLYNKAALDKRLSKTTSNLYMKMLGLAAKANFNTMTFSATIGELADAINMSTRTVRRHLPTIVQLGYVEVRRHKSGRKMNMPNVFVMLNDGVPCCSEKEIDSQQISTFDKFVKVLGQNWQADSRDSKRELESKESNLTGKPELPFSSSSYVGSATPETGTQPQAESKNSPTSETGNTEWEQKENSKSKNHSQPEVSAIGAVKAHQAQEEKEYPIWHYQ